MSCLEFVIHCVVCSQGDHPPVAPKPDPPPKIDRPKPKELDGYVGFANLPNQVYRKAVKKGFDFTLMVVGKQIGEREFQYFPTTSINT